MDEINLSTLINDSANEKENSDNKLQNYQVENDDQISLIQELETNLAEDKHEEIINLIPRSTKEELKEKVKSTMFGGYKKSSVLKYVTELKDNLDLLKFNLEQQIKDLASEKLSLYQECSLIHNQLLESEKKLQLIAEEKEQIDETNKLEDMILSLEEKNKIITDDYNKLKFEYNNLEQEIENINENIADNDFTEDLEDKDREINQLKEQNQQLEESYRAQLGEIVESNDSLKLELDNEKAKYQELLQKYESYKTNDSSTYGDNLVDVYNMSMDSNYITNKDIVDKIYAQMKTQSNAFLNVVSKLDDDRLKVGILTKEKAELTEENIVLENRIDNLKYEVMKLKEEKSLMMDKLSKLAKELVD